MGVLSDAQCILVDIDIQNAVWSLFHSGRATAPTTTMARADGALIDSRTGAMHARRSADVLEGATARA